MFEVVRICENMIQYKCVWYGTCTLYVRMCGTNNSHIGREKSLDMWSLEMFETMHLRFGEI